VLTQGVLFFPVTPFGADGAIDESLFERHVVEGLAHGPGAVFAACGAGELHALSTEEHAKIANRAVKAVAGNRPVYVGAGGPLPTAIAMCHAAAKSGADGVLVLPPYLVSAPQKGLIEYVAQVAAASPIPVIVYARANARFTVEAAVQIANIDNVLGFKDGIGDIELIQRIMISVRRASSRPFLFLNGLPTAELSAAAYRGMNVPIYSSGVFAFAPEIATAFWKALSNGQAGLVEALLSDFYAPFATLRDQAAGFAVSLIKAGVRARGLPVGPVRAPLIDPTPEQIQQLESLLERGLHVAARANEFSEIA
jgi:5-dehydro-4-deoxyglucarate dehydratase